MYIYITFKMLSNLEDKFENVNSRKTTYLNLLRIKNKTQNVFDINKNKKGRLSLAVWLKKMVQWKQNICTTFSHTLFFWVISLHQRFRSHFFYMKRPHFKFEPPHSHFFSWVFVVIVCYNVRSREKNFVSNLKAVKFLVLPLSPPFQHEEWNTCTMFIILK